MRSDRLLTPRRGRSRLLLPCRPACHSGEKGNLACSASSTTSLVSGRSIESQGASVVLVLTRFELFSSPRSLGAMDAIADTSGAELNSPPPPRNGL